MGDCVTLPVVLPVGEALARAEPLPVTVSDVLCVTLPVGDWLGECVLVTVLLDDRLADTVAEPDEVATTSSVATSSTTLLEAGHTSTR